MLTNDDLSKIQTIVRTETKEIIQKELKPIREDIIKIRKDIKTVVNFFDQEYLELRNRVEKIEQFLNLTTT